MSFTTSLPVACMLPQTQKVIHKCGLDDVRLIEKLSRGKNYLCVIDLFTALENNAEAAVKHRDLKATLCKLMKPVDIARFSAAQMPHAAEEDTPSRSNDEWKYKQTMIFTGDDYANLYFMMSHPNLIKKLIVQEAWLRTEDPNLITMLTNLIQQGMEITFGHFTSEMLASRTRVNKGYTSYLSEDFVPSWWEKAFYEKEISGLAREELIAIVKKKLAEHAIDENIWAAFIDKAEDYQIAGLLYKDDYYLGKLDPNAGLHTITKVNHLFKVIASPAKIKDLFISGKYRSIPTVVQSCHGLRNLTLGFMKVDLTSLSNFIHLEGLAIKHFDKQGSLENLPTLTKLKYLAIEKGTLIPADLEAIANQPLLENLDLSASSILLNGELHRLLRLPHLKQLALPWSCYLGRNKIMQSTLALLAAHGVQLGFGNRSLFNTASEGQIGNSSPTGDSWGLMPDQNLENAVQQLEKFLIEKVLDVSNAAAYAKIAKRYHMQKLGYAAKFYAGEQLASDQEADLIIVKELLDLIISSSQSTSHLNTLTAHLLKRLSFDELRSFMSVDSATRHHILHKNGVFRVLQKQLEANTQHTDRQTCVVFRTPSSPQKIILDATVAALSSERLLADLEARGAHDVIYLCTHSLFALQHIHDLLVNDLLDISMWHCFKNNPSLLTCFCLVPGNDSETPEFYPLLAEVNEIAHEFKIQHLRNSVRSFLLTNEITSGSELAQVYNSFPSLKCLLLKNMDMSWEILKVLQEFCGLKDLCLNRIDILNQQPLLKTLSTWGRLEKFRLMRCKNILSITEILKTLATHSKQLRSISLHHFSALHADCVLKKIDLELLASMKQLETIDLRECIFEEDADVQILAKLPRLKRVRWH